MKLAEALVLRADIQKRIAQMRERLQISALVQEGEQPPEKPQELLSELDQLLRQLGELIIRINKANYEIKLPDGMTITEALAHRDVLSLRHSILNGLVDSASLRMERYARSELRRMSTVDIPALRRQLDDVARQRREIDTAIQAVNWSTDLEE